MKVRSKMFKERVKFQKGKQREFLEVVKTKLNCVSVRGILQFGFNISYSSLKDYFNEKLFMPRSFFEDLCYLAKIEISVFDVSYIKGNWGQVKGGRLGRK